TSTFAGGIQTSALEVTGTGTSTVFRGGVIIEGGLSVTGGLAGSGITALIAAAVAAALAAVGAAVVTFTNKRIQPRTSTAASGDITPDLATANIWQRTALSAGIAINAPTGTPVLGEVLVFMLLDDGTSRA